MLDATEEFVPSGPPELPLALAHMAELGSRERTRIVCVYGPSVQLGDAGQRLGIADLYPFGRFSPHVTGAAELLPIIARVGSGWLLRRRIRASSSQLDVFAGAGSERAR